MRAARIYQHRSTEAVALRLQKGVTGPRSHGYSCGGFGDDTHISTRIPMSGNVTQCRGKRPENKLTRHYLARLHISPCRAGAVYCRSNQPNTLLQIPAAQD